MANKKLAFTLPELLVVVAIITVLAGMLFPVFSYAKSTAYKANCLSNFKQIQLAAVLYVTDWDDRMMPVNHQPSAPANSQNDRTWVQLTLPYAESFRIFNCPSDYGVRPPAETTFDQDLVPGDTYSKYYSASQRVNAGYNYVYLAPVFQGIDRQWRSEPRTMSSVNSPSETLLFVDSVYGRSDNGTPYGGGSWLVVPPCRYLQVDGGRREDSFQLGTGTKIYTASFGWKYDKESPYVYGSAWPWHSGKMNLIRLDGSAKTIRAEQLSAGCDVRENWLGVISNPQLYMWDLY